MYASEFEWDGTNWSGPSDTGNPHGAAFPPGAYELQVKAIGSLLADAGNTQFEVVGNFRIQLTP